MRGPFKRRPSCWDGKSALEQGRKKLTAAGAASEEGGRSARGNARWEEVIADYAGPDPVVPPNLTFDDRLTLHLGDVTVRLIYFGRAHSTSDVPEYRDLRQTTRAGKDVHARNVEGFWRCAERLSVR